jgi:hypothetical protein
MNWQKKNSHPLPARLQMPVFVYFPCIQGSVLAYTVNSLEEHATIPSL